MVDPISVAGTSAAKALTSVLTKRLQSKTGVRLGSRDERRQVYARFQNAATEAATVLLQVRMEHRLHTTWLGRWPVTFRPWAAYTSTSESLALWRAAESELLQAFLDLRLVANPEPLEAAGVVLERLDAVRSLHLTAKDAEIVAATSAVFRAQRELTDVC
ncbi:hypothetical protein, partial [Streptomyces sp. NPDC005009]